MLKNTVKIVGEVLDKNTDYIGRTVIIGAFIFVIFSSFTGQKQNLAKENLACSQRASECEKLKTKESTEEKTSDEIIVKSEELPETNFQELTIEQAQKEITRRNPNSPLTAQQIYDSAKKYNASFTIAILQGIQESNFGKDKNSKPYKTKNLWNWDNTDNGNTRTFETFEEGMEWYMSKVEVGYGNNAEELLQNFVTKTSKKRYASDPNYENSLKAIYKKIINN